MLRKHHFPAATSDSRRRALLSPPNWIALAAIVLCCASRNGLCQAKEPANGPPLPGLVSAPRKLPGIGRWQLARKSPRGSISAIAWNADGTAIAYNDDTYVRICDGQSLETKKFLAGHVAPVTGIDWNQHTHRIASSSYDGTVRIWSAAGLPEKVLEPNAGPLQSVAWSKDGALLAASSSQGSVCIWGGDGRLALLKISQAPINCIAWSPDGARLVTGDDDGHVKLWTAGGKLVRDCDGHVSRVIAVAWSLDGKHFASTTYGEQEPNTDREHTEARIYTADGSTAATIPSESTTSGLRFSPDSQRLAIYDLRIVRICDLRGAETDRIQVPLDTTTHPNGIAWSPKGEKIALGAVGVLMVKDLGDGSSHTSPPGPAVMQSTRPRPLAIPSTDLKKWLIRWPISDSWEVWSAAAGKSEATFPEPVEKIARPAWSPSGDQIAYVEREDRLRAWRVGAPSTGVVLESESPLQIIAWGHDGTALAALDKSGNLKVTHIDGKAILQHKVASPGIIPENGMQDSMSRVVFSSDGKSVAVVERDAVQLIPLDGSAAKTYAIGKSNGGGWGADFWWSKDGQWMTTMRKQRKLDCQILTWNLQTGMRTMLDKFGDELAAADCSPDGKLVAIGYDTGFWQVRRLDDAAATPLESDPAVHLSTVRSIAFSPDGRRFATGGWEGWIKIWSREGKLLQTLYGNVWPVHILSWSTDGQRLFSVGRDGTTLVWSLQTGRPLLRFETARDQQLTLITEDGRIFGPSPQRLDQEFWALLEKPSGEMETVGYSEFLRRIAGH